ncbi:MAG: 3-carboxy-cis,cis-muconate cycloisomerase, partial [Mesorhizobium sp.]
MTVSPFDHPLLSALLGDEEAARHFSVEADIDAMLAFERA